MTVWRFRHCTGFFAEWKLTLVCITASTYDWRVQFLLEGMYWMRGSWTDPVFVGCICTGCAVHDWVHFLLKGYILDSVGGICTGCVVRERIKFFLEGYVLDARFDHDRIQVLLEGCVLDACFMTGSSFCRRVCTRCAVHDRIQFLSESTCWMRASWPDPVVYWVRSSWPYPIFVRRVCTGCKVHDWIQFLLEMYMYWVRGSVMNLKNSSYKVANSTSWVIHPHPSTGHFRTGMSYNVYFQIKCWIQRRLVVVYPEFREGSFQSLTIIYCSRMSASSSTHT
jgi:hypothetical protein